MSPARFVPIATWPRQPRPDHERTRAPFKRAHNARLKHLWSELAKIGAENVLIQLHLKRDQIRQDGWPYEKARPTSPGVILTFERRRDGQQPRTFTLPCDTYDDWSANLYAIALSLEALRAVDRYGVTTGTEQYEGFRQIAAGPALDAAWARAIIARYSDMPLTKDTPADKLRSAIRKAAAATHTDRQTGDTEAFLDVIRAREILTTGDASQ